MSANEIHRLRRQLGVTTVVDLHCADDKHCSQFQKLLKVNAINYMELPIRARMESPSGRFPNAIDYADYYEAILKTCGSDLSRAFFKVAIAAPQGVVFACQQGKDRTGLLAAAMQEAVGLSQKSILADYAASGPLLRRHAGRFQTNWEKRGISRTEYLSRYYLGAQPLELLSNRIGGKGALLQKLIDASPLAEQMTVAVETLQSLGNKI